MVGGLMQEVLTFLGGLPAGTIGTWETVPFVTTKAIDTQRSGNVLTVGAPVATGRVYGIGMGQATGQYTQQQISKYAIKIRLYSVSERDVISATDWVAENVATYFLNLVYSEGNIVLGKMNSYEQILKERGMWIRSIVIMLEVEQGP